MSAAKSSWLRPSLDWLLVFVPIAVGLRYVPAWQNGTALFIVSALAIIPIAGWMGHATEQLAHRMGEGIGGLLNASFGNAAELIIALMALHAGHIEVVKASITGSIIGNLLLVLGAAIFAGGVRHKQQRFNKTAARVSCTALILASAALVIPTAFHHTAAQTPGGWTAAAEQRLSLAIAVVLICTYGAILIFSLVTHKQLFTGGGSAIADEDPATPDDPAAEAPWPVARAVGVLVVATAAVAWMSEFLVGAVEAAQHSLGVTETFVGVIIVAIVGNAAEHSTAITTALKNKMDLSLGIAIGSSLQIALFVAPVLVFASYFFPHRLNLEFSTPEVAAMVIATFVTNQVAGDGESNWLEGVQLLALYVILGILFYFLPAMH